MTTELPPANIPSGGARARWISTLSTSEPEVLEQLWESLWEGSITPPSYRVVRQAEHGLVMVRGRSGGSGKRFNLGEMTVTRCTVQLVDDAAGTGYVQGRNKKHAERAALIDAMLQTNRWSLTMDREVIQPLLERKTKLKDEVAKKSAATKVDFFTMTRTREDKK